MGGIEKYIVAPEKLRMQVTPSSLGLAKGAVPLVPEKRIVLGNEEAMDVFLRGLEQKGNILLTGKPGQGIRTLTKETLEEYCRKQPNDHLTDKIILYNFRHPEQVVIAELSKGEGHAFAATIDEIVIRTGEAAKQIEAEFSAKRTKREAAFARKLHEKNIRLKKKYGIPADFVDPTACLPQFISACKEYCLLLEEQSIFQKAQKRKLREDVQRLQKQKKKQLAQKVSELLSPVQKQYLNHPLIADYIRDFCQESKVDFSSFTKAAYRRIQKRKDYSRPSRDDTWGLDKYRVNLAVDHRKTKGIPVTEAKYGDEKSLIGIVQAADTSSTPHFQTKVGEIVACSGGVVFLGNKLGEITNNGLEDRILDIARTQQVHLHMQPDETSRIQSTASNAIRVTLRLVACVTNDDFAALDEYYPSLSGQFQYKAHFQSLMKNTRRHRKQLVEFLVRAIHEHNQKEKPQLPQFSAEGLCAVFPYLSRDLCQDYLPTHAQKITHMGLAIAQYAAKTGATTITREHVHAAWELEQKGKCSYLWEQQIREGQKKKKYQLATTGEKTGQINVLLWCGDDQGTYAYGVVEQYQCLIVPSKDNSGFENTEKDANLSGPTFNKSLQQCQSAYEFMLNKLHKKKMIHGWPPGFSVITSLPEEYNGVEGPSMTAANVYVFTSAGTGFPVKQNIFVTGSMDHTGTVLAVDGLNEKIEDGYKTLKARGDLGNGAGVLIPYVNIRDCNLCEEVYDAMKRGEFTVYYHKTAGHGYRVLMGKTEREVLRGFVRTFASYETIGEEEEEKSAKRTRRIETRLVSPKKNK